MADNTTICLVMIIKNEGAIMPRLLKSVNDIIDDIVISDTGSTDNTIEVVKKTAEELGKPIYIDETPFVNFAHNRTISVQVAQRESKSTYLLFIDADMILCTSPKFDKNTSFDGADVIQLIQKAPGLEYYNTRLVRRTLQGVKYCAPTHEYLSYPGGSKLKKIDRNLIYINDIGDGRCKDNKFDRDYKLLKKGIEDEPKAERYYFYLAETCKFQGKHEESNIYYQKRIEFGGWVEEVCLSYVGKVTNYLALGKITEAEKTALESNLHNPNRSEALYLLCEYHRQKSNHAKSLLFYELGSRIKFPENDVLFVRGDVYNFLFDYEFSIIAYYLQQYFPLDEVLRKVTKMMMKIHKPHLSPLLNSTFMNMKFYVKPLPNHFHRRELPVVSIPGFNPSSTSVLRLGSNRICYLTRQVNYKIRPKDGSYDFPGFVDTKYSMHIADNEGIVVEEPVPVPIDTFSFPWDKGDIYIRSIEDLRMFTTTSGYDDKKTIYAIGTTRQYNAEKTGDTNCMALCVVNLKEPSIHSMRPLKRLKDCEKNWTPIVGTDVCVYSWYPLYIVDLRKSTHEELLIKEVTKSEELPEIFKNMRGSSAGVPVYNESGSVKHYWFVTHMVYYGNPRTYIHNIVKMSPEFKIVGATVPFFFDEEKIEFCLGLLPEKHCIKVCYSVYDRCSKEISIPLEWIERNFVYI